MKRERTYNTLLDEVEEIRETNPGITGKEIINKLSKTGWTLNHYMKIFFDITEMKNFFCL